jgi:RNA polymerase sigma-70 factor (ECF subfamily)
METDNSIARLVRPIERRMFETVWRILRHSQDAEDALQITLVNVWQERAQIESHPAPQALILKICAAAAIDQFRQRCRQPIPCDVAEIAHTVPSARPPPLDEIVQRETLDIVMGATARLSQNQAAAVVMRFIQGESDAAIAAALGCGAETVREHLARGRERLGRILGQFAPHNWTPAGTTKSELHQENE